MDVEAGLFKEIVEEVTRLLGDEYIVTRTRKDYASVNHNGVSTAFTLKGDELRICGLVHQKLADPESLERFTELLRKCLENSTCANCPKIFDPDFRPDREGNN